MSKKTSLSLDIKLRSIKYRINSNCAQASNMSLTTDRFDAARGTPNFFLNTQTSIYKKNPARYYSKTYRKSRALYLDMEETKPQFQTIDAKVETTRTFSTFMDREGNEHWKAQSRIKLPLIESNPEMSLIPFDLEYEELKQEVQRCTLSGKEIGQQIAHLKAGLADVTQKKNELDVFVNGFMLKCQSMKKALAQNRLKQAQCMIGLREKMRELGEQMGNLSQEVDNTAQKTKDVQRSVFDTSVELQFEPHLAPEL